VILTLSVSIASAQSPKDPQRPRDRNPRPQIPTDVSPELPQGEVETLKIDTNLVTVPVIGEFADRSIYFRFAKGRIQTVRGWRAARDRIPGDSKHAVPM